MSFFTKNNKDLFIHHYYKKDNQSSLDFNHDNVVIVLLETNNISLQITLDDIRPDSLMKRIFEKKEIKLSSNILGDTSFLSSSFVPKGKEKIINYIDMLVDETNYMENADLKAQCFLDEPTTAKAQAKYYLLRKKNGRKNLEERINETLNNIYQNTNVNFSEHIKNKSTVRNVLIHSFDFKKMVKYSKQVPYSSSSSIYFWNNYRINSHEDLLNIFVAFIETRASVPANLGAGNKEKKLWKNFADFIISFAFFQIAPIVTSFFLIRRIANNPFIESKYEKDGRLYIAHDLTLLALKKIDVEQFLARYTIIICSSHTTDFIIQSYFKDNPIAMKASERPWE